MHSIKFAIQNARSEFEVTERLLAFLDYLRQLHIDSVLPQNLHGLSARSAAEVKAWAARLAQESAHTENLTVAGDLWLKDVAIAFDAAASRLDELGAQR